MSVKELKALIGRAGLSCVDCVEKSDLRARAREAVARLDEAKRIQDKKTAAAAAADKTPQPSPAKPGSPPVPPSVPPGVPVPGAPGAPRHLHGVHQGRCRHQNRRSGSRRPSLQKTITSEKKWCADDMYDLMGTKNST